MGDAVSMLVPLVGPDSSQLPAKWLEVADGVISFGLLGLTYTLTIVTGVWVVSAHSGHPEWAAKTKGTIISVLVAVIILASADAVTGFLIEEFIYVTPRFDWLSFPSVFSGDGG